MVVGLMATVMVVGVALGFGLDHWWPIVASAVACWIITKTV